MKGSSESRKTLAAKGTFDPFVTDVRLCWIFFMVYINVDVGTVVFVHPEVHFLVLLL